MKLDVKEKWVGALRSGDYKQGIGQLRMRDLSRPIGEDEPPAYLHCCLGVLCELHAEGTGTEWEGIGAYYGERTVLPAEVVQWAGLRDSNPTMHEKLNADGVAQSLAALNDAGVGFGEIAALIDRADL